MSTENKDKNEIEGHEYDGIRELDNQLPRWWLNGFYLTIVFAVLYYAYYQLGPGRSIRADLRDGMEQIELENIAREGIRKLPSQEELVALANNPARKKEGNELFHSRCVACHGDNAQGVIGPNLTDDYWLHGGKLFQIAATITNGVSDKGMPAWGPQLTEDQIESLAVYVKSLRGSNPPNPKAPQGDLEKD